MKSIYLEEMTWPEVREVLASGVRTVVIIAGSTEQHGHHLPLATDSLIGRRLGELVVQRLGEALLAPPITVGCSDHHMRFPGTISLRPSTFQAILEDYCGSLAAHGFTELVLIPSHGGNFTLVKETADALRRELRGVRVIAYTDLIGFLEIVQEVGQREYGVTPEASGGHAGEGETSCVLAIRPDLVDLPAAKAGFLGSTKEAVSRVFTEGLHALSPTGVIGDPQGASGARGARYLERLTEALVGFVKVHR